MDGQVMTPFEVVVQHRSLAVHVRSIGMSPQGTMRCVLI